VLFQTRQSDVDPANGSEIGLVRPAVASLFLSSSIRRLGEVGGDIIIPTNMLNQYSFCCTVIGVVNARQGIDITCQSISHSSGSFGRVKSRFHTFRKVFEVGYL
jgi:hypothetical protein